MTIEDKLSKAMTLLREKWDSEGSCLSCSWHATLEEHDIWEEDILHALKNGGILELPCINKDDEGMDYHKGVKIPISN